MANSHAGDTETVAVVTSLVAPEIRSRYVKGADGVPLNVVETGEQGKPAIIFIHGLGQSHLSWEYQLRSGLSDEYHLIAYDLRGHGNSGKPWRAIDYAAPEAWAGDLERVIRATGADRPLLVTWSFGTWVGVDFLKTHKPEEISGLVLIGGLGGLIDQTPASSPELAKEGERLSRMRGSGWLGDNLEGGDSINQLFIIRPVDPSWSRHIAAINALLPPYARPHLLARSFDNLNALSKVRMPTWLVVGDQDITLSVKDARALADRLSDARVSVFEGSGHLPFAEDKDKFNRELHHFAREVFDDD